MSDINITLNAKDAITTANALKDALNQIAIAAKKVERLKIAISSQSKDLEKKVADAGKQQSTEKAVTSEKTKQAGITKKAQTFYEQTQRKILAYEKRITAEKQKQQSISKTVLPSAKGPIMRQMLEKKALQDQKKAQQITAQRKISEDKIAASKEQALRTMARERRMDRNSVAEKMVSVNKEERGARNLVSWRQKMLTHDRSITAEKMKQANLESGGTRRVVSWKKQILAHEKAITRENIRQAESRLATMAPRADAQGRIRAPIGRAIAPSTGPLSADELTRFRQLSEQMVTDGSFGNRGGARVAEHADLRNRHFASVTGPAGAGTAPIYGQEGLTVGEERKRYSRLQQWRADRSMKKMKRLEDRAALVDKGGRQETIKDDYAHQRSRLQNLTESFQAGHMTQKEYNKALGKSKTSLNKLDKEMKKINKAGRTGAGIFSKLTRVLVAIASVMFIWQKVKQMVTAVTQVGEKYVQTLSKMQGEMGRTKEGSEQLSGQLQTAAEGTVFGVEDMYGAYVELRRANIGSSQAIQSSVKVLQIARHENIKLADAAEMVAGGNQTQINSFLKLNDAMSKTAEEAKGKFKKAFADLLKEVYTKEEPLLIKFFEDMTKWIKNNKDDLIAGLQGIAKGIRAIAQAALGAAGFIVKFMGKLGELAALNKIPQGLKQIETMDVLEEKRKHIINLIGDERKVWDENNKTMVYAYPKVIAYYEKELKLVDSKIAALKLINKGTEEIVKTNDRLLRGLDEVAASYSSLKSIFKMITTKQYEKREKDILREYKRDIDVADQKNDPELRDKAWDALVSKRAANLQNLIAPVQNRYAEFFKITGKMSDEYFDNEMIKRKQQLIDMGAEGKMLDELMKKQAKLLYGQKLASRTKAEEAGFEATGSMSEWLKRRRMSQALSGYGDRSETGMPGVDNRRKLAMDVLQIKKDEIAKTVELEEAKFEALGIITADYIDSQKRMYQLAAKERILSGMSIDDASAMYDEQLNLLNEKLLAPYMAANEKTAGSLSKVDEGYYARKMWLAERAAEKLGKLLKNEELAEEFLAKRKIEIRIESLKSQNDVLSGLQAGAMQLASDSKTVAQRVSDAWISGSAAIGQAWKSGFFDVMTMNFDNLEDAATNFLKSIQKMLIDVLYQELMYGPGGLITGVKSITSEFLGKGKEPTAKGPDLEAQGRLQNASAAQMESAAINQVIAAHTAEMASIDALILKYMVLNAVRAGGSGMTTWSGQNATGAGTSTIRGGGGGGYGFAQGGWITEPILGRGMRTGKGYTLGEAGPELVTPAGKVAGGGGAPSVKINIENKSGQPIEMKTQGTQVNGQDIIVSAVIDAYRRDKGGLRTMMGGR